MQGGNESRELIKPPMSHPEGPPARRHQYVQLKPGSDHLITTALIGINVLVYVIMVASGVDPFDPRSTEILDWGGIYRPYVLEGGWWRLITFNFVHCGFFHLLLNMYALFIVGLLLEPRLGKWRMGATYLSTGIVAGIVSIWWHPHSVAAGASGSIFGLFGVYIALLGTNIFPAAGRRAMLITAGLFVAVNLLYGTAGNIDNAAHIGGLLTGLVLGWSYATPIADSSPDWPSRPESPEN
jgi:rhomboid protease GluP